MDFDFGVYDAVVVAVVIGLTGAFKPYVAERWVPLLPYVMGFLGGLMMYFMGSLVVEGPVGRILANVLWNGFLYAVIAGQLFKTYRTTIRGQ